MSLPRHMKKLKVLGRPVYVPIKKLPAREVNLYGFLKAIRCEGEFAKLKSFTQLMSFRYYDNSTRSK